MRVRLNSTSKSSSIMGYVVILIFVSVFFFTGLGICISGVVIWNKTNKSGDSYDKITAVISDIQEYGNDSYAVYVDYTYGGQEYNDVKLDLYSSDMYVGGTVDILVNKESPSHMKSASGNWLGIAVIIFGSVFMIIPIAIASALIRSMIKTARGDDHVKKTGMQIYAVVESVVDERYSAQNGNGLCRVFCTYDDIEKNTIYRFVSDPVSEEVKLYVSQGMTVPVYVNKKDYNDYYVDLSMYGSRNVVDLTRERNYY